MRAAASLDARTGVKYQNQNSALAKTTRFQWKTNGRAAPLISASRPPSRTREARSATTTLSTIVPPNSRTSTSLSIGILRAVISGRAALGFTLLRRTDYADPGDVASFRQV